MKPTRLLGSVAAACLIGSLLTTSPSARADQTYTNPVTSSFADTYADPSVIQGHDGYYYAFATADPLRSGGKPVDGHIARTKDWVHWEYVGGIFNDQNRPTWATKTSGLWAPDVRYIGGKYVMYFTVTDTTLNANGWDPAIGVATAPSPAGPWTAAEKPIVAPIKNPNSSEESFYNTIDPAGFTDKDGNNYLYYGNYYGGVHVVKVSADGLSTVGESKQVGAMDRYEGSYVTYHDGYYYLSASSANCCAGPATGYSVFTGRSTSPMGPFLDKDGLDLNASNTGGTTLVTQNGNRWIGTGHHAQFTDASGRDWLVYHALDRNKPWLNEPGGLNQRPMLIDPIDYLGGWPTVRAGAGPSDTAQTPPVTSSVLGGDPANPSADFTGMPATNTSESGPAGKLQSTATSTRNAPAGSMRVSMDVALSDQPVSLSVGKNQVHLTLNPSAGTMQLQAGDLQQRAAVAPKSTRTALHRTKGWQRVSLTIDGSKVEAQVSSSGLADPHSVAQLNVPGLAPTAAPLQLSSKDAVVDNITAHPLAKQATTPAPTPQVTKELWREDFTAEPASPRWTWLRKQDDVKVADGKLHWPLRNVDLGGDGDPGALLLTEPGEGDWIMQTQLHLDLGENTIRNYQSAGLVVHNTDDDFARLGTVAIHGTRTVEYGRQLAMAPGDKRLIYGGAIIGATAPNVRLAIAHHTNEAGEQLYRAGVSRDQGKTWVWDAVWTFPKGVTPRIGCSPVTGRTRQRPPTLTG